jgi:hypothetical protein
MACTPCTSGWCLSLRLRVVPACCTIQVLQQAPIFLEVGTSAHCVHIPTMYGFYAVIYGYTLDLRLYGIHRPLMYASGTT